MLISVPVGIGIAIFLTSCARPLRRPIGIAVELLAGIPSIIYGIWGLFVLARIAANADPGPDCDLRERSGALQCVCRSAMASAFSPA
jgi:ABC-type phosphate transport system permease subunit